MSAVGEHYEKLQHLLALGQTRAERLARLLGSSIDETGRPTVFVLPHARGLLSESLLRASDEAADIGIETGDTRWTAPVALLHNASLYVAKMTSKQALTVAALLQGMRGRVTQLRQRRAAAEVRLTLS